MRSALGILIALFLTAALCETLAQEIPATPQPYTTEIVLERYQENSWRPIDSRLVLDQNDNIRFRAKPNFSGYLYVTNKGTSGRYEVLFPSTETGMQNKTKAGVEFLVPAERSFRVVGPPGQEIVYWIVSPVELDPAAISPKEPQGAKKPGTPPTLRPRCDATILRARGDCIDISAGPHAGDNGKLPVELAPFNKLQPRDLLLVRKQNTSIVSTYAPLAGPVIYEFRIAHR